MLFTPGRIGRLELRNRLVMCPMGDYLPNDDGTVSDAQLAFHEARARGGVGMVVVGSVSVAYPSGSYAARQTAISDDRFLPGLRELTRRVHAHGAAIAAQLVHDGPRSLYDFAEGRPVLVPSIPPIPEMDELSQMVTPAERDTMLAPLSGFAGYREATDEDLENVIEAFASAAVRARDAGFDGIEIHAGHGYLIDAFLSPASNRRTDRWGTDRALLPAEVVRAIRDRVELPLWCRINAEERFTDRGETLDATIETLERLDLDAVHVTAAAPLGMATGITESHTPHRPGALLSYAREVKRRLGTTVIAFGRLEPPDAEAALERGDADLIAMGRKLLADPDLPVKVARGEEPRPCIYRYRCIGNIFLGERVACVVNAATGREHEVALEPAASPRAITIAGGGPAGLETARLLAIRGHHVTIVESSDGLGGRLALAARCDDDLDRYLRWLTGEVERAGVEVRLGEKATDADVDATGACWTAPLGAQSPDDLRAWFDEDDDAVGPSVAVLGGGSAGVGIARLAATRGRTVTLVEPSGVFAVEYGLPGRFRVVRDLIDLGVTLSTEPVDADTVVAVHPQTPTAKPLGAEVAGDRAAPRGIEGAVQDALRIAQDA